jgi:ABC-type multidrug transport system fused ATPase/permease subunit
MQVKYSMRDNFKEFGEKTIKEIRLWFWAAAVIPVTALAGMFFVWIFGTDEMLRLAMTVGATVMFSAAVIWWWWALHSIYKLITLWTRTETTVTEVRQDLKDIKMSIRALFFTKDK